MIQASREEESPTWESLREEMISLLVDVLECDSREEIYRELDSTPYGRQVER